MGVTLPADNPKPIHAQGTRSISWSAQVAARLLGAPSIAAQVGGIQLVLAGDDITAADERAFGEVLALPPSERPLEAWPILARYLDRSKPAGIVAQSEAALLLGAKACAQLGLPGPSVEAALATASKLQTRRCLGRVGLAQPRHALVRHAREVHDFAQGEPVVLKAIASSRQRLVTALGAGEQAGAALARLKQEAPQSVDVQRLNAFAKLHGVTLDYDPTRDFLVESFAAGMAVECDGVVSGNQVRCLGVSEQVMIQEPAFFIEGYVLPARLMPAQLASIECLTRQALQTLGLTNTGFSVEFRQTAAGPQLIEVNGRLGWDEGLGEMFQAATGYFPAQLALRVALGKSVGELTLKCAAALAYRSNYASGIVRQAASPPELRAASGRRLTCVALVGKGDRLLMGLHPASQPHVLLALSRGPRRRFGWGGAVSASDAHAAYGRARRAVDGLPFLLWEDHPSEPESPTLELDRAFG